jgi:prepilin-type N-terminal cleavage/methylation domain-containing protein
MSRRINSGGIARPIGVSVPTRLESGFTLLEVCFVLFIVAVLFAVAAPPTARLFQEEQLRRPVRELQSFAKEARRSAIAENRSYQLLLLDNQFILEPADRKAEDQRPETSYRLPSGRWIFLPNGLCEPMMFLFQRGQAWIKFRIDPLTSRIEDQESYIP